MKCDDFGVRYLLYHYKELDESGMKEFAEHLESCENCRRHYDEVRLVIDECESTPVIGPSEAASARILREMTDPKHKEHRSWRVVQRMEFVRSFAAAAAILLVVGVLALALHSNPVSEPARATGAVAAADAEDAEKTICEAAAGYADWVGRKWTDESVPLVSEKGEGLIDKQIEELDRILACY